MWFLSSRKNRRSNSTPARRPRARLCLEMLEDRCVPSAGQLDPTFGSGGIVTNSTVGANAEVLQPDGKIVTVGDWSSGRFSTPFGVVRYTTSGALDSTFGSGGVVKLNFGKQANAAALQSDGKIVVVGYDSNSDFVLARLNSNGSLDNTFGKKGEVTTSFSSGVYTGASAKGVVIQGDGKIVVAGTTSPETHQQWALARYNPDGSLDTTFGTGGKVISAISPNGNVINGIVIQPDGKLVVAGDYLVNNLTYFAVGRYNSNGTFDTTFGNGGLVTTAIADRLPNGNGDEAEALALQSDGKIVVVGNGSTYDGITYIYMWDLARYNTDGSLDTTFGGTGYVTTSVAPNATRIQQAWSVAIQPSDGKIVLAGDAPPPSSTNHAMALGRYNLDGSLDTTFGGTGIVITQIGTSSLANGVAIYPITGSANDGKIVAVGGSTAGNFVARYLPSEPEIASFTASSYSVTTGSSVTLTVSNITGNPGASVTQVAFYLDTNGDGILDSGDTLLGYGTQTSPGVWTFTFDTTGLAAGSYTLFAQAQDSYGVVGDPVAINQFTLTYTSA